MTEDTELCTKISDKVKMAGFLEKKGSMLWKRYWFVLEDSLLLYYKSQLEYINLSPCRGSVNMGLVSSVQPRRSSKDPIIHLVSRTHTLVLKAKDRMVQEKWLQSLLESTGKSGGLSTLSAFRFSLDDLPGQVESATLPRRLHSGSLDTVWKPAAKIPKTKMIDKVLTYEEEEEPDENQNTSLTHQQKSATLDSRRGDFSLVKLKNAIGRRKMSSPVAPPGTPKIGKQRRESFLRKIFKKSPTKQEEQEVHMQVPESDGEDPLYDKIQTPGGTPGFGCKNLLPESAMAELKGKLMSRESLEEEEAKVAEEQPVKPPALPPRGSLTALNTLVNDGTTVAIIHQIEENGQKEDNVDDSEDSELSGHYQRITKNGAKPTENEDSDLDCGYQKVKSPSSTIPEESKESIPPEGEKSIPPEEQYTVVNKNKKKKKMAPEVPAEAEISEEAPPQVTVSNNQDLVIIEVEYDNRQHNLESETNENTTILNQNSPKAPENGLVENDSSTIEDSDVVTEENDCVETHEQLELEATLADQEQDAVIGKEDSTELKEIEEVLPEAENTNLNGHDEAGEEECTKKSEICEESLIMNEQESNTSAEMINGTSVVEPTESSDSVFAWPLEPEPSNSVIECPTESETSGSIIEPLPICNHGAELKIVQVLRKVQRSNDHPKDEQVQIPLSDLNTLLLRLQEITTAPLPQNTEPISWTGLDLLVPLGTLKRRHSDPDYDIPRPHAAAVSRASEDEVKLTATGFFNSIDKDGSAHSLEPDSLEAKKEERKEDFVEMMN